MKNETQFFKLNYNITNNWNFFSGEMSDQVKKGGWSGYLNYLEDNSHSRKNQGRKGLICRFMPCYEGINTPSDLHHFIEDAVTKLPKAQKYSKASGGRNLAFKELASTYTGRTDEPNFRQHFNSWIKHEINFLKKLGFEVLGVFVHEGEFSPHIHIIIKNFHLHKFTYRNKVGEYIRERLIYGTKLPITNKTLPDIHKKHYLSLKEWCKDNNQTIAPLDRFGKQEETTISGIRRGSDINRYARVLKQITDKLINDSQSNISETMQEALNEITSLREQLFDKEKNINIEVDKKLKIRLNEILKEMKLKGKIR